jgi:hypothetical protein
MSRKPPTMKALLVTALSQLYPDLIPFEELKQLSVDDAYALYRQRLQVHHWTYVAVLDGGNHPANLSWMPLADHRDRTRKIDVPTIAKMKRIARATEDPKQARPRKGSKAASARAEFARRQADQAARRGDPPPPSDRELNKARAAAARDRRRVLRDRRLGTETRQV